MDCNEILRFMSSRRQDVDFGDPQTFLLMRATGQSFHLSSEIAPCLLQALEKNFAQNPKNFGEPRPVI